MGDVKNHTYESINKTEPITDIENKFMVTKGVSRKG